jgi:hypothetical protein
MASFDISSVREGLKDTRDATYHRGKSWEYCYAFFRQHEAFRSDPELMDKAALHLGFYLANWGMFRNSFLMETDYRFYASIIEVLIKEKYDPLWESDVWNVEKEDEQGKNLDLLFELEEDLRSVIKREKQLIHREKSNEKTWGVSVTLITKIIMGTMGCVPAYDRYFKEGLKKVFPLRGSTSFNKESFKALLDFSREESCREIYTVPVSIGKTKLNYPPMKLLDLYFWLRGYNKS